MNEQTSFVEPLKRFRRSVTGPEKIAARIKPLADWYVANKPSVKSIRISSDDAYSLRHLWADEKKRGEVTMAGFRAHNSGFSWHGFDLVEST